MIPLILLNEKEFTTTEDNEDYTLDPDKEETPAEEEPAEGDDGATAAGAAEDTPEDDGGYEIPPEEGDGGDTDPAPAEEGGDDANAEDGDNPDAEGGDDYTIDADTEELADDDDEENLGDDTEGTTDEDVTADSEMPEDQDKMHSKKIKKLLQIYKSFYNEIMALNDKVANSIFPMNPAEEYIYKIVVDTLTRTIKVMYSYIVNEYNSKEYEENVYRLYHFKSQLEMMHILLKKIKKYRDEAKTI